MNDKKGHNYERQKGHNYEQQKGHKGHDKGQKRSPL